MKIDSDSSDEPIVEVSRFNFKKNEEEAAPKSKSIFDICEGLNSRLHATKGRVYNRSLILRNLQ